MRTSLRKRLIACWKKDYTDEQAAMKCGMSLDELRLLLNTDKKLADDRKKAMAYLRMKAKDAIAFDIEQGKKTSWYAERKMPEEYSSRQNVTVTGSVDIPLDEKKQMIDDMFAEYE